jgi:plasmid stabilization system protein ParE
MPRGDKSAYTGRQQRKAEHIEKGYERRGVAKQEAERRAWATVNKQEGGGKKSGSGRRGSGGGRKGSSRFFIRGVYRVD